MSTFNEIRNTLFYEIGEIKSQMSQQEQIMFKPQLDDYQHLWNLIRKKHPLLPEWVEPINQGWSRDYLNPDFKPVIKDNKSRIIVNNLHLYFDDLEPTNPEELLIGDPIPILCRLISRPGILYNNSSILYSKYSYRLGINGINCYNYYPTDLYTPVINELKRSLGPNFLGIKGRSIIIQDVSETASSYYEYSYRNHSWEIIGYDFIDDEYERIKSMSYLFKEYYRDIMISQIIS